MTKIINFCKSVFFDAKNGRILLRPLLLAAAFLAAKFGAFWPINILALDHTFDYGFLEIPVLYLIFSFICGAYFLVFCSYLLFRALFLRGFKKLWAALGVLILAGCVCGYLTADVNHQRSGVLDGFLLASLIAICVYVFAATLWFKSSLPVSYAIAYCLSFLGALWLVGKGDEYATVALEILCPLAWAFYFKKFQETIINSASKSEI